jgi:hypothetical protein
MRGAVFAAGGLLALVAVFWSSPAFATQTGAFSNTPSGTTATCPNQDQWLLLYWRGPSTAVANTAPACPGADRFWTNSGGRWLGYSPAAPREANDDFEVVTGQALFVHGSATSGLMTLIGTLTAVIGDPPGPGGTPSQQIRLIDDQGRTWSIVVDDKTVLSGTLFSLNGRRVRVVGEPAGTAGAVRAHSIEPAP